MKSLLKELEKRNPVLYWFGWFCIISSLLCILMTQITNTVVLGINAWIKPMKFFISTAIFCWTMGWFMGYLNSQRKVRVYSWMVVVVMLYELAVITWQAANGRISHFNITTPLYGLLFSIMGMAITILSLWTGYIGYLFFRQKNFTVPMPYIWGIRLGIIFFVIFSFEGGMMATQLSHTVGAPDGGPGLPVVNWSKQYGDLRTAHFMGMHSLQILPLFGYYMAKSNRSVYLFSALYFLITTLLLVQAMMGVPLLF